MGKAQQNETQGLRRASQILKPSKRHGFNKLTIADLRLPIFDFEIRKTPKAEIQIKKQKLKGKKAVHCSWFVVES
ncbi:MAG: hypothetical protein WC454_09635 [Phycisphaerae bacterium]